MAKKINFDKLPIAGQRMIIAKDLIARLDAKKFVASGGYFQSTQVFKQEIENDSVQLKKVFTGKKCRGCQIGGLFAAALDRCNALKLSDLEYSDRVRVGLVDSGDLRTYLTRWFTRRTLEQVECAFEGWENDTYDLDFRPFGDRFEREQRMRLICKNIIKNKGQFKPRQILALAKA